MRFCSKKLIKIIPLRSMRRYFEKRLEDREKKNHFFTWSNQDQQRRKFYAQFISPGDLVFDVGANQGNRSKIFAELGAVVIAVEPQKACATFLKCVFRNRSNFHLVKKALGATPCKTEMRISNAHTISSLSTDWINAVQKSGRFPGCSWDKKQTVEVDTLDHLIRQYGQPTFVKIDVEGFEDQVLAGLSVPVRALSIEFTPEILDSTFRCIEHCCQLGFAEFQISLGESMQFALPDWVHQERMRECLSAVPRETFGDVYVRFPKISPHVSH